MPSNPRPRTPPRGRRGTPAGDTSWDRVATWYDGWVGDQGSRYHQAIVVPAALAELERAWRATKRHPLFAEGHFSICPGVFVGSPATGLVPFSIPDTARLDVLVWHHPDAAAEDVRAELEACGAADAAGDPWLREHPRVGTVEHSWPQSVVDTDHPIVAATRGSHERANGGAATVAGFAAVHDATYLNAGGVPAIGYGPGDLRTAHAVDEHVAIEEIVAATRTYSLLAADWCGVHSTGAIA
jgi:acetylornithine deacetylase